MTKRFLYAAALCLSLAAAAAAQQPQQAPKAPAQPADLHAGHGAHADKAHTPTPAEKWFTDVELVNQDGEKVRFYSDVLKGKTIVVNAFFTTCTSVCPIRNRLNSSGGVTRSVGSFIAAARTGFTTVPALLEQFDQRVRDTRSALARSSDADLGVTWTLKAGERTVFSMPRAAVLRSFVLSHMIHHRGQLTVYLRLRDVPLPAIYGPSADSR